MSELGIVNSVNANSAGGVPKPPVGKALLLTGGVEGDKQRDLKYHGGPARAVCLFSLEKIAALRAEGHPIDVGTTGENLTIEGLDWGSLEGGQVYSVGGAVIELQKPAQPCKIIADSFCEGDSARIDESRHTGWSRWYASVSVEGEVKAGDTVTRI